MQYGLCYLSVVALRSEASDTSELISQVLYGDYFKVLEHRKSWSRIRLGFDKYEGWIDNKQFQFIDELEYKELHKSDPLMTTDLVDFVWSLVCECSRRSTPGWDELWTFPWCGSDRFYCLSDRTSPQNVNRTF